MEKKKVRWTVIDTVIVLVIIAVIAVGFKKLGPMFFHKSENEKVKITIMMKERNNELAQAMHAGDKVTLSLTEKDGGVITGVRTEPAERLSLNSVEGTYVNELVADKVDIYVDVEADCSVTDTAIKTGDTAIKVGAEIPVRGKGFASTGYVITAE